MLGLLWLIPTLPLAGFLMLALVGARLPRRAAALIGAGSVGLSAALTLAVAVSFITGLPAGHAFSQTLWTWLRVDGFAPRVTLTLDALSLVMTLVVTVVSFLIHVYSTQFMAEDEGYARFFAYLNLFVASMLILVLADNLLLLYLGWEGVGLCSYLLIGFWYRDRANARAAMKAFVVTRVGDVAMAVGLFLIFTHLGTLQIQELMQRASIAWLPGSGLAIAAAALLLGGAVGKSAQLPLQTWLPDAMAGPTPVSALIHAATMVTAGVYLIARMHVLFTLAPLVQWLVAVIGAATLLLAGCSALTQRDLKRVLAYSTISQIGYMFLALGVGAWSAAIFHFVTHALFKSLLFLAAGVVITALHEEHDMAKMGGLRTRLPVTFWTFLIGAASLSALPLVTSGFYSKEMILYAAWASPIGSPWLWAAGTLGAFVTAVYTFRMVFLTFFGPARTEPTKGPGAAMQVPLIVLAVGATVAGFVELPRTLGNVPLFSDFLRSALPNAALSATGAGVEAALQLASVAAVLLGVLVAYGLFLRRPNPADALGRAAAVEAVRRFWLAGWGFDWLYDRLFVRPFVWLASANKDDFFDRVYDAVGEGAVELHRLLSATQTGRVRWYAVGVALGAVILLAIAIWR